MYTNVDLSYLLTLMPQSIADLHFRREQLIELRKSFMKDYSTIGTDGSFLALRRIEAIDVALALKVSEPAKTIDTPLPRSAAIVNGWAQQADHLDASAAFTEPKPALIPVLLKGGDQHDVEYPEVVAR